MSSKPRKPRRRKPPPAKPALPAQTMRPVSGETRAADVMTICWMLSAFTTTACLTCTGLARGLMASGWDPPALRLFAGFMSFAAAAAAVLALGLMAVVYRLRKTAPPTPVSVFAVGVSVLALGVALWS